MPRNHDYRAVIEQPLDLAVMDLNDAQTGAKTMSRIAGHQVEMVDHLIREHVLWIEGEVEDPIHQHLMEGNLDQIREEMLYLAEITNELSAQQAALIEIVKTLLRQRDLAIDARTTVESEVIKLIADNHGCTREQAEKVLTLLITSDEAIMEADLIIGYDVLAQYRDQLEALIAALDVDMEG